MSEENKVKIVGDANLSAENAKVFKKAVKEDQKTILINGKEKRLVVKTYSTGDKNKGVRKGSLVAMFKKGKRIG
jgi:hypothetical protein